MGLVCHAGTARRDGAVVTDGGRVLGVTALGADFAAAVGEAYRALGEIGKRRGISGVRAASAL